MARDLFGGGGVAASIEKAQFTDIQRNENDLREIGKSARVRTTGSQTAHEIAAYTNSTSTARRPADVDCVGGHQALFSA